VSGRVRQPAVAGAFYPAQPVELDALVEECLRDHPRRMERPASLPGLPAGILVPHAGLVYSGGTAAYGWRALVPVAPSTVVVVGTCHTAPWLDALATSPASAWSIPGAEIAIDTDLRDAIVALGEPFLADGDAHAGEHAIEVQLPFLRRLLPETRFVPITAGCTPDAAVIGGDMLGRLLAERRAAGERVALAISTDFAHYPPQPIAESITTEHAPALQELDIERVHDVERHLRTAGPVGVDCGLCGLEATLAGLAALRAMGATRGAILARSTSADRPGSSFSRTVGYASFAFA
jgi:MEMO1 family protein